MSAARDDVFDAREAVSLGEAWGPLRASLAAAAVVMLAVGWVIHLEADTGPAAESVLAQQTAARVAFALGRASLMECKLETRDGQGRPVRFDIEWRDTGQTRVRLEGPEGIRHRTLQVPSRATSLLLQAREGPRPAPASAVDAELAPAHDHLTPAGIASLLAGKWEPVLPAPGSPPGVVEYRVSQTDRDPARVVIDVETSLPLSLGQFATDRGSRGTEQAPRARARFAWNRVSSSTKPVDGRPRSAPSGRSEGS